MSLHNTVLCDRWASEDVKTNLIKSDMSPQLVHSLHLIILPLFPHSWLPVPGSHLITLTAITTRVANNFGFIALTHKDLILENLNVFCFFLQRMYKKIT